MPSFLSDNNTPNRNDPEWVILQKILGSLNTISGGGSGGGPFVEVSGDTMTGPLVNSANGALSTPALKLTGTPITGGSATTTKPLVLIEPTGTTSSGWDVNGSMLGINMASGFASGYAIDVQKAGSRVFSVYNSGTVAISGNIAMLGAGQIQYGGDTILRRAAAANLALGAADAASPVAQTISVQNVAAGTTDTAGAHTTYAASRSTGTGVGGGHLFQVSPYSTTGSSQNTLVNAFRILSGTSQSGSFTKYGSSSSGPEVYQISGTSISYTASGTGLGFYSFQAATGDESSFLFNGTTRTQTSGAANHVSLVRSFAPTSGTGTYAHLLLAPTINQTGGANGITYGLRINPSLVAAADFRALEISDGNVVLPKTVTAAGTTGARTINKLTGTVNFAAAATSLVVTNSYVTTSSIIIATVGTNDATMKSVQAVAGSGSFTLYASAAPTGETRVDFHVTN